MFFDQQTTACDTTGWVVNVSFLKGGTMQNIHHVFYESRNICIALSNSFISQIEIDFHVFSVEYKRSSRF